MQDWMTGLVVAGILLILIEILLIPGLGVTGVLGFICLAVGIFLVGREHGTLLALSVFGGSLVLFILAFVVFFRSPASKWFVLSDQLKKQDRSLDNQIPLDKAQRGKAHTDLYPTGKGLFAAGDEENIYDVIASGEFIDEGKEIEVVRLEGNRIFVRPVR